METVQADPSGGNIRLAGCSVLLIDEADHLAKEVLKQYLEHAGSLGIPVICAYDPHRLLRELFPDEQTSGAVEYLTSASSLSLAFTGHIRINRPVYSFLRTLLNLHNHSGGTDYSCIDVLYAGNRRDTLSIFVYYRDKGYHKITLPGGSGEIGKGLGADEIAGLEFDCVLMILDDRFYYDSSKALRADGPGAEEAMNLLYEGISRTREKLCILVYHNRELFTEILSLRER